MCETISIRRKLKYIFKKSNENLQFLEDLHILDLPSVVDIIHAKSESCVCLFIFLPTDQKYLRLLYEFFQIYKINLHTKYLVRREILS